LRLVGAGTDKPDQTRSDPAERIETPSKAIRLASREVIDLVELTGSAAGTGRAFAAGRQLTRWRNEAFVQEVQDRLLALAS
jgi:glucose/arabinose dehydrogenase